jgi:hypothetical protein
MDYLIVGSNGFAQAGDPENTGKNRIEADFYRFWFIQVMGFF